MIRAAGAGAAVGIFLATLLGIGTARANAIASFSDVLAVTAWLALAFGGMFAAAAALGSFIRSAPHTSPVDRGLGASIALFFFVIALRAFEMEAAYPKSYSFVHGFPSMLALAVAFLLAAAAISLALGIAIARFSSSLRRRRAFPPPRGFAAMPALLLLALFAFLPRPRTLPSTAEHTAAMPISVASAPAPRVVLLGCDGADPEVLDRLLADGALPHLQSLQDRGVRATLHSIRGRPSPAIWTSIATGVHSDAHGIHDFYVQHLAGAQSPIHRFPIAYLGLNHGLLLQDLFGESIVRVTPVNSTMVRRRAIWEIAAGYGISCGVVNWLVTWPAPRESPPLVTERAFIATQESGATALEDSTLWQPPELGALVSEALSNSAGDSSEDEFMGEIALRFLEREQPTFFAATFRDVDAAQHLHWNDYEPQFYRRKDEKGSAPNSTRIPDAYARFDRIAGALIAAAGPEAIVIVVSDHGHGPWFTWLGRGTPGGHTNSPDGIFLAAGPGIRRGAVASPHCLDVAPTVLHLLGLPAAEDFEGRVLNEIFEDGSAYKTPLLEIASYEQPASAADSSALGEGPPGEILSSTADAGILEKLETLGYIR